ncbi:MAG: hypothetical protein V2J24_05510 [Pseudomonadales bacterium]|nr:hypothetical protein [Pseudomonadales bacterium]
MTEEHPAEPDPGERAPDALLGLWRRTELALADPVGQFQIASGAEHVLWFQTPTRYADLRFGDEPSFEHGVFCGRQHWDWPEVRFHHEIDSSGVFENDEGTLEWLDANTLIETGEFEREGRTQRYRERWERQSPSLSAGTPLRLEARERRLPSGKLWALRLQVGQHSVIVYTNSSGPNALFHERTDSGSLEHRVGPTKFLPEIRWWVEVDSCETGA